MLEKTIKKSLEIIEKMCRKSGFRIKNQESRIKRFCITSSQIVCVALSLIIFLKPKT